jgi:uncharacterized protein (DUF2235 family)
MQATSTTATPPPRKLVVCCDGTNNTLTAGVEDTNVLHLYEHLRGHADASTLLYYDPGVGTPDSVPPTDLMDWLRRIAERTSGLASGRGIYDNIAQAYLFLMRNWRGHDDRIYLFGFSRGAFTVRCVAGMVNLFGILRPQHEDLLPTLIRVYFSLPKGNAKEAWSRRMTRKLHSAAARPAKAASEVAGHNEAGVSAVTRDRLAAQIRSDFCSSEGAEAWVHWVGVWDTVESVGLPGPLSRSNPATASLVGKRIRHVRHALALDEHRYTFLPRLYEEPDDIHDPHTPQSLKQRWFPGVHCDVGGSYPVEEAGLPDAALQWMVDEVHADIDVPAWVPGPAQRLLHDPLWDTPWWALAGMCTRNMQPLTADGRAIAVIEQPRTAEPLRSVWSTRRPSWPLVLAGIAGLVALWLSGACVLPGGVFEALSIDGARRAIAAASDLARMQMYTVVLQGLWNPDAWRALRALAPGWAMAWDLVFVVCWGYWLARIASRGFWWLASRRAAKSQRPPWRALGFTPLLAVAGDATEDVMLLLALALDGLGGEGLSMAALWFGGLASVVKWVGLAGCLPWLLIRVVLMFPGAPAPPPAIEEVKI